MEEPLYPQALLGYRCLRLRGNQLSSLYYGPGQAWQQPLQQAQCRRRRAWWERAKPPHQPGWPGCSCGLYAYHRLDMAISELRFLPRGGGMVALVAGRGESAIHPTGWRAEQLAVLALAEPSNPLVRTRGRQAAEQLGVPLLPLAVLRELQPEGCSPAPPEVVSRATGDSWRWAMSWSALPGSGLLIAGAGELAGWPLLHQIGLGAALLAAPAWVAIMGWMLDAGVPLPGRVR